MRSSYICASCSPDVHPLKTKILDLLEPPHIIIFRLPTTPPFKYFISFRVSPHHSISHIFMFALTPEYWINYSFRAFIVAEFIGKPIFCHPEV